MLKVKSNKPFSDLDVDLNVSLFKSIKLSDNDLDMSLFKCLEEDSCSDDEEKPTHLGSTNEQTDNDSDDDEFLINDEDKPDTKKKDKPDTKKKDKPNTKKKDKWDIVEHKKLLVKMIDERMYMLYLMNMRLAESIEDTAVHECVSRFQRPCYHNKKKD